MIGITNVTSTSAGDGFPMGIGGDEPPMKPPSYLDSDDNKRLARRLEDWWVESRDAHSENRREQMMDADYYDGQHWTLDDAAILLDRGQAPLTFPLIKQMCDWVIGTERRTRIDWDVLPRKDSNVISANVKKQVLKFISDVNGAGWERSSQFNDQVKVGIGWTEECYNNDQYEEPVTVRHQDWKGMWWDPYSRSNVMRDCRYMHRAKWLDVDYAIQMFPDRADEVEAKAVDTLDPMLETLELEASLPMMFFSTPLQYRGLSSGTLGAFGTAAVTRKARRRLLCIETWFKRAANTPMLLGDVRADVSGGLSGQRYDPANESHANALKNGVVSLVDSVSEQMWFAIWTPGCLLRVNKSPYKHNRYPFTPAWGYRRHRDGMPYGLVRQARDSQDEYNKRRSKILFDLSTNRIIFEDGVFDEDSEAAMLEEAKRPDGEIRVKTGGLEKLKIERATDAVTGQINMLAEAKRNINEATGVTPENTGQSSGDQSGRAILAKQQQGSVTTAEIFDNYRQAIQESGQKTLSNCEQFLTLPKIIRIVGPDGAPDWININKPTYDPMTGTVSWHNDITADEADFIIDETDYRETVRMAMSEMLFELIGRLPPTVAMALLDIAVDMTDLPNKAQLAARIRQATGQVAPGQENTPEAQAAQQAQQQASQQAQQTQQAQADANVRLTDAKTQASQAKATLDTTNAQHKAVLGKGEAMQTASLVRAAPGLAQAADRLWDPSTQFPMPPNQFSAAQ